MPRKKQEINPECGKRMKQLLKDAGRTQQELADASGYSQQYISNIASGKKHMTREFAEAFCECVPYINGHGLREKLRAEYLLAQDDYQTIGMMESKAVDRRYTAYELVEKLIDVHGYKREDVLDEENSYSGAVIRITPPSGKPRDLSPSEYMTLLKSTNDYLSGQLLLLFHQVENPAEEYSKTKEAE